MTTVEAIRIFDCYLGGKRVGASEFNDAARQVRAELARVAAERDRLIEAWPGDDCFIVKRNPHGGWSHYNEKTGQVLLRTTKAAAVRAAAGLDAREGE